MTDFDYMPYPIGPSFPRKERDMNRVGMVTYTIESNMFNTPSHTTIYIFSSGRISCVGGAVCFTISREQANFMLRQARDPKFHCTIRKQITK